jgi:hypothetical protein
MKEQEIPKNAAQPEKAKGFALTRLEAVMKANQQAVESTAVLVELLEVHPELDKHFCIAFGIQPQVPFK